MGGVCTVECGGLCCSVMEHFSENEGTRVLFQVNAQILFSAKWSQSGNILPSLQFYSFQVCLMPVRRSSITTMMCDVVQGKGTIETYFLEGKDGFNRALPDPALAAPLSEHDFK